MPVQLHYASSNNVNLIKPVGVTKVSHDQQGYPSLGTDRLHGELTIRIDGSDDVQNVTQVKFTTAAVALDYTHKTNRRGSAKNSRILPLRI